MDFPTLTGVYAHEIIWKSYTKYGMARRIIGNHCIVNEYQHDRREKNVRETLSVDDTWTE